MQLQKPVLHVTGANGSGKTTLLKVLCSLTQAEQGHVQWRYGNRPMHAREATPNIAFTGHHEALNAALTVRENVTWAVNLCRHADQSEISSLLHDHQLEHLAEQSAASLSAGQRRRVALLRAVFCQRAIWIWDEPYANLDVKGRTWVDGLLQQHIQSNGVAIISSHHSLGINPSQMQSLELLP